MAPSDPSQLMDLIFQQATTAESVGHFAHYMRNLGPRELRDTALASPLASGQDPLTVLNPTHNTLAFLYVLAARLHVTGAQAPSFEVLTAFCKLFNPEQARYAPDRVTLLAKGIQRLAVQRDNAQLALEPLGLLLSKYPPDPSYLTTIHHTFTLTCLQAKLPTAALPLLAIPITNIDTNLSDLSYNDNLIYHYTGGIILAMLKKWLEAEEFFEICATAPATFPAALQMEALKKLKLVQLIAKGKNSPLPKYIHPQLLRQFKQTPYQTFINAYPHNVDQLREIVRKEHDYFATERNEGLLRQAIDRAPRWALKKLTATYLSLNLAEIGKAVKIESEEQVRGVLLEMIESGDLSATISADGSVTFSDPPPKFTKEEVDQVLKDVQDQSALLEYLDKEMARSKDYLGKAAKSKDDSGWAGAEEDVYPNPPGGGAWVEDPSFA